MRSGQCVSAIHADAAAIRNRGGAEVRESAEAIVAVTSHIKQIERSMLQRLRPPVSRVWDLRPRCENWWAPSSIVTRKWLAPCGASTTCTHRRGSRHRDLSRGARMPHQYRGACECSSRHHRRALRCLGPGSAAHTRDGHGRRCRLLSDVGESRLRPRRNPRAGEGGWAGACRIDTRPGRGTCIARRHSSDRRRTTGMIGTGITIMLVDDHAIVRAGFRRLLEQQPDLAWSPRRLTRIMPMHCMSNSSRMSSSWICRCRGERSRGDPADHRPATPGEDSRFQHARSCGGRGAGDTARRAGLVTKSNAPRFSGPRWRKWLPAIWR